MTRIKPDHQRRHHDLNANEQDAVVRGIRLRAPDSAEVVRRAGSRANFLAIQIEAYVMTTRSRYFTTRTLAGLAILMLSSTVTGGESDQWSFKPIDKNGDGVLNKEEVRDTRLQKHWDTLDTNTDGQISRSEFSSFMDGNVSKEELEAAKRNHGEPTKPTESWFTSPEHKPEDDDG